MRAGQVRIIAGLWRSRKVPVPPGVRPAQDAHREALFNAMRPLPRDGRCLDLYAGSGCMGLEALSRGAADVTFVDRSARACRMLKDTLARLGGDGQVVTAEARAWLRRAAGQGHDVVFADPPYATSARAGWWEGLFGLLGPHLAPGALVCVESGAVVPCPAGWQVRKHGRHGMAHWGIMVAGARP